jgi:ribonuclease BN (tRNA processing enzyme)
LIDQEDTLVWVDAGPGTFAALQSVASPHDVDAVVITHIHGDHCLDLFPLFNLFRLGPRPRRGLRVFAPEGAAEHLAGFVRAGPDHDFYSVFAFHTVARGDEVVLGGLTMRFGESAHPVPTLALRIESEGRAVTYSSDTGPGGDLPELASGSTVLLVERLIVTHLAPTLDPAVSITEAGAVFGGPVEWAAPGLEVAI